MKKLILIVLVFFSFRIESCSHMTGDIFYYFLVNNISGVQADFYNEIGKPTFSIDNNITLAIINLGFNYKFEQNTTCFVGLGLGNLIQVQYGFPIIGKENLIRVRTDIPLGFYFTNEKSILNYTHLGLYFINSDKTNSYYNSIGLTISINTYRLLKN